MKEFRKVITMLLIGLTVAVVIYPFFHKIGHSISTLIVGGDIVGFHIWPLPNIMCNVGNVSVGGKVLIGVSGMLFPIAITTFLFHPQKKFWLWYANLILRGICLLSIAITGVAVFLFSIDKPVANEDITTVLNIAPNLILTVTIASLLIFSVLIIIIAKDKPVKKIGDYLLK